MKIEHKILHEKFQKYGANAREWTRKCALLLPEIAKHRIWEQKRFGDIYEYAAKLAGMSRPVVDDSLRVLRKIEDKPDLQKVVELKGIGAVRPVAAIATPETQAFWAEKAMQMSKHTLEVYVRDLARDNILGETGVENSRPGTGNVANNPDQQAISLFEDAFSDTTITHKNTSPECTPKRTIVIQVEPEIAEKLEKLKGQGDWNELLKKLLTEREAHLEAQKPQAVKAKSRHLPAAIQKHVEARTNGNCSHPGCTKPMEIKHHTKRFGLEKTHNPDQIQGLCKEHERIAHLGLIENEESHPADWKLRKEAKIDEPKFEIDKIVQKFRSGGLAYSTS